MVYGPASRAYTCAMTYTARKAMRLNRHQTHMCGEMVAPFLDRAELYDRHVDNIDLAGNE
jgi:hypothetical protein